MFNITLNTNLRPASEVAPIIVDTYVQEGGFWKHNFWTACQLPRYKIPCIKDHFVTPTCDIIVLGSGDLFLSSRGLHEEINL